MPNQELGKPLADESSAATARSPSLSNVW